MLKVIFHRDNLESQVGFTNYKIRPGIFLQLEDELLKTPREAASHINDLLFKISPHLCQFFYSDEHFDKRPVLDGCSAGLLGPKNGVLYLKGSRAAENDLTRSLIEQLPSGIAELITPIKAITRGMANYSAASGDMVALLQSQADTLIQTNPMHSDYINRRIEHIAAEKPHFAIASMLQGKTPNDGVALLTLSYLSGFNFQMPQDAQFFDSVTSRLSSYYTKAEAANITSRLRTFIDSCVDRPQIFEELKHRVTKNLANSWVRHDKAYSLFWGKEKIGRFGKLLYSADIDVASINRIWVSSVNRNVGAVNIPRILESLTPYFPPAIRTLLPDRHSPEMERMTEEQLYETLLVAKPYALGGLYFHKETDSTIASIKTSRITVSLDDVSPSYLFEPERSGIDLNQSPERFEQFADEVANQGGKLSIPGFQIKAPASLSIVDGRTSLGFATPESFTHIIKFPSHEDGRRGMVYSELFGMLTAAACGVNTPPFRALSTSAEIIAPLLPSAGLAKEIIASGEPAYIVELFDRPCDVEEVQYMNEDFLSATKQANQYNVDDSFAKKRITTEAFPSEAGQIEIEQSTKAHSVELLCQVVKQRSTNPEADLNALFVQLITNTLIGNGDAHLKNFSLLHRCYTTGRQEVQLSPAYDVLSSRCLSPKLFRTPGVCMLGNSYSPSRNEIINDGIEYFGFTADQAANLLDSVVDKAYRFSNVTLDKPLVTAVFHNSQLGRDMSGRIQGYMHLQLQALAANTPNPDVGAKDERLFKVCYPDESYEIELKADLPGMSDMMTFDIPGLAEPDNSQPQVKRNTVLTL